MIDMPISRVIVCHNRFFRLRLDDGRHVFMEWAAVGGPWFYRDRAMLREIPEWWEDMAICRALDWFFERGKRA